MTSTVKRARKPSAKRLAAAIAPIMALVPAQTLIAYHPGLVPFEPAAPFDIDAFAIPGENPVALSDEEFEAAIAALEDQDAAGLEEVEDSAGLEEPEAGDDNVDRRDFAERMADVSAEQKDAMVWSIANRLDDRLARAPANAVKNLERARKKMVTGRVSLALCASGDTDASFVNRTWMEGKEFNVYGLLKLADIAAGLVGGVIENAVNIAVIKSMFALEKAGIPYDFDTAKAAASSSHAPARPGVRQHLTRHTVAAGTASTQAGSTMHALMALGVVSFVATKNPTYTILQNATTEALRNAKFEMSEEA